MKKISLFDHEALQAQLEHQQAHVWDIDKDIDWSQSIDTSRYFLPMDEDAVAFPGASPEQHLALSQFMGLIVNATISESEESAHRLRGIGWQDILDSYPVNPEMRALGEQFFAEEIKHAALFRRFHEAFCNQEGIDPVLLKRITPQAYGSMFQRAMRANARAGGHAFWWVVAVVEEVSLLLYRHVHRARKDIDPLFYQIHKAHFEEESRHTNYAFLMLDLIKKRNLTVKQHFHKKLDLIYSEFFSTAWVLTELTKIYEAKKLQKEHPFFAVLASCIPLMESMPKRELIRRLFVSAPYISLVLNHDHHKLSKRSAKHHGAVAFSYPKPEKSATFAISERLQEEAAAAWILNNDTGAA